MRSASPGLTAALTNSTTLCRLWKITRQDGHVLRFTDHDQDITIASDGVYLCAFSFTASAIFTCASQASAQSNTMTLNTDPSAVSEQDVRQRLYDGALHQIMFCDYTNTGNGVMNMYRGITGQIKIFDKRRADIEIVPIGIAVGAAIAHESYSLTCRNALGDVNCTININDTAQTFTVATVTPKESAGFASDLLTSTGFATDFFNGDTITIGARTYTFVSTLPFSTDTPANASLVHITGVLATTLVNFAHCINNSGGTPGIDYANSFATYNFADPLVSAAASGNSLTITARQIGSTANGFTVSYTPTGVASVIWQYAALTGGYAGMTISAPQLTQPENFFATGFIQWQTGSNADTVSFVQASSVSLHSMTITQPPLLPIQIGDTGIVFRGCDKQITTCLSKFNNVNNFRGEPFVPSQLLIPVQSTAQVMQTRLA